MANAFEPSPLSESACQALGVSAVVVETVHVVAPLTEAYMYPVFVDAIMRAPSFDMLTDDHEPTEFMLDIADHD
jgi:hypothetical protein